MNQMEELLENLTEQLDNKFRTVGAMGNMPRIPMMVLYAGEHAYQAKAEISNILRQVWRKRADGIAHLRMEKGEFVKESRQSGKLKSMSVHEFQQEIDSLYDQENCFRNMNDFFVCMLFNARDYTDLQSFQYAYEKVMEVQSYSGFPYCFTMSMVLLDESASGNMLSVEIKRYLRIVLEEKKTMYRSTVVLSNRLYNGALLRGKSIQTNYELAGNILLLANSTGTDYSAPISIIFPAENGAYYLTAAYSRIYRPNRKICEIILHKVLEWLEDYQTEGNKLSIDQICQRLEITGGKAKYISDYFKTNVLINLPPAEILEYFPRKSKEMEVLGKKSFRFFDQETFGAADVFYKNEFLPQVELATKKFEDEFQKYLLKRIKVGEAASSLSDSMVQKILEQFNLEEIPEEMEAYLYLVRRAEADFLKSVLPMCEKQLQELRDKSKNDIQRLSDLIQEFQEGFFIDSEDANIKRYYERVADQFLEKAEVAKIVERFYDTEESSKRILQILKEVVGLIISENPIFAAPLVEEMTLRMGQDPIMIQETLQNELMNDISDKIRLRTLTALSILQEIFIVNQKEEDGHNTKFFNYLQVLKKGEVNVSFFDSGNSNSIEVVRLYRCDANLLV